MNNVEVELLNKYLVECLEKIDLKNENDIFWTQYVKVLSVYNVVDNTIVFATKNAFSKQIIENTYLSAIINWINKHYQTNYVGQLITKNEKIIDSSREQNNTHNQTIADNNRYLLSLQKNKTINKDMNFQQYIVGDFNRFAILAGKNIGNKNVPNSLFIFANVGLGKTHLLHAIANHYLFHHNDAKVKYVSSDDFSREIYACLTSDNMNNIEKLKQEYEACDLLLIDDVQILVNRKKANEIMFNIFNKNISNNHYIVWAADTNPDLMDGFDTRIKSRFHSGIFTSINQPDFESIKKIIVQKITKANLNYSLSDEAIEYIARRNCFDIRRLEGDINQIIFYALNNQFNESVISFNVIKQILTQSSSSNIEKYGIDIDPSIIVNQICTNYGVKSEDVLSKSRLKQLITPRNICMYVLREKHELTYEQIARIFSNRSHSTVIEAVEKIKKSIQKDQDLLNVIQNIYYKI